MPKNIPAKEHKSMEITSNKEICNVNAQNQWKGSYMRHLTITSAFKIKIKHWSIGKQSRSSSFPPPNQKSCPSGSKQTRGHKLTPEWRHFITSLLQYKISHCEMSEEQNTNLGILPEMQCQSKKSINLERGSWQTNKWKTKCLGKHVLSLEWRKRNGMQNVRWWREMIIKKPGITCI